jgi:ribonuclease HI
MRRLLDGTGASLLIVGDASGTTVDKPAAWATVVYQHDDDVPYFLLGSESNCTNNRGELSAIAQGLWFAHYTGLLTPKSVVLCVSDSEVTIKGGKREYSREAHAAMWKSVDFFEGVSQRLLWKWVPRNTDPVQIWCDKAAGELRLVMKDHLIGLTESER